MDKYDYVKIFNFCMMTKKTPKSKFKNKQQAGKRHLQCI